MNRKIDSWMYIQTYRHKLIQTYRQIEGLMETDKHRYMYIQTYIQEDWMDQWIDRQTDKQIDILTYIRISYG